MVSPIKIKLPLTGKAALVNFKGKTTNNKTINNKTINNKTNNNKTTNNNKSNNNKSKNSKSNNNKSINNKANNNKSNNSKTTNNKTSNNPKFQMPFSFVDNETPKPIKKENPKPKFPTIKFRPGTFAAKGHQYRIPFPKENNSKKTLKSDTRWTQVGQKMDTSRTQNGQKTNTRRTQVRKKVDKKDILCHKCNGRKIGHHSKRNTKCKVCVRCTTPKCGECKTCLNPLKKKACIEQECVNPILAKCTCAPSY
jgi:hypothetical protein